MKLLLLEKAQFDLMIDESKNVKCFRKDKRRTKSIYQYLTPESRTKSNDLIKKINERLTAKQIKWNQHKKTSHEQRKSYWTIYIVQVKKKIWTSVDFKDDQLNRTYNSHKMEPGQQKLLYLRIFSCQLSNKICERKMSCLKQSIAKLIQLSKNTCLIKCEAQ